MPVKIKRGVDKVHERDIMVKLALYCHEILDLNNAQIARVFRRDPSEIRRIITKNKPKGA